MNETRRLIIFDGDDTLWKTQERYDQAKAEFSELLRRLGFVAGNPIEILDAIDSERASSTKDFSANRFVESMKATYTFLCDKENRILEREIEEQISTICAPLFTRPELYEDTVWTLETLVGEHTLLLATKGNPTLQNGKVDELGLRPFFRKVYVLRDKSEREYSEILRDVRGSIETTWVVGNSVRSDVNPALMLGWKAILIPRGSWRYEEAALAKGDVTIVHSLREAVTVIQTREANTGGGTISTARQERT